MAINVPLNVVFVKILYGNDHKQMAFLQYEFFYEIVSLLYQRTVRHIDHKRMDVRQYVYVRVWSFGPSVEI